VSQSVDTHQVRFWSQEPECGHPPSPLLEPECSQSVDTHQVRFCVTLAANCIELSLVADIWPPSSPWNRFAMARSGRPPGPADAENLRAVDAVHPRAISAELVGVQRCAALRSEMVGVQRCERCARWWVSSVAQRCAALRSVASRQAIRARSDQGIPVKRR